MKKSKLVKLGILTASIAELISCQHKHHKNMSYDEYQNQKNDSTYYVDDGNNGYYPSYSPVYIYNMYGYGGYGGRVIRSTGIVYRSTNNTYHTTEGARTISTRSSVFGGSSSVRSFSSARSVSTGGFGSSAHSSGGFGHSSGG